MYNPDPSYSLSQETLNALDPVAYRQIKYARGVSPSQGQISQSVSNALLPGLKKEAWGSNLIVGKQTQAWNGKDLRDLHRVHKLNYQINYYKNLAKDITLTIAGGIAGAGVGSTTVGTEIGTGAGAITNGAAQSAGQGIAQGAAQTWTEKGVGIANTIGKLFGNSSEDTASRVVGNSSFGIAKSATSWMFRKPNKDENMVAGIQ